MDLKFAAFHAAREGKLARLKFLLFGKSKNEIELIVSSRTNGTTPLVIACRNGDYDVAHYLITVCHADIEQVGYVTFDGETIKGAPPLWCAAAAGSLSLVKLLVSHGACVNSTTKSNSTPLRAACFDGHIDIATFLVQHGADIEIANMRGHTCLMIACYQSHYAVCRYLLNFGACVNKKTVRGSTALHDCAESGSLLILKMLLDHGAKFVADVSGTTPLMCAAINGHSEIVEYFTENINCSTIDKIDALELLGATDVDKRRNLLLALKFWKRAMILRYEDPNFTVPKPDTQTPFGSYIEASEVKSLAELEELRWDPDEIRMQALLIRERILGPGHPDTVNFLRLRGAVYADDGNFEKCIKLWMYALDVQEKSHAPVSPLTQSVLISFVELFSLMISDEGVRSRRLPNLSFDYVFHVFERSLKAIEKALKIPHLRHDFNDTGDLHRTLVIVIHLVGLLCKLLPQLNLTQETKLKRSMYKFVHMKLRARNNWTLLHLACFRGTASEIRQPMYHFPSQEIVKLLLEVGAEPNAVDFDNNTPLHIVAMSKPCPMNVFKTLLNHGAHFDLTNYYKLIPFHYMRKMPVNDLYPLKYINLQCLCAQVVRMCDVPYRGLVHKNLETFLDAH